MDTKQVAIVKSLYQALVEMDWGTYEANIHPEFRVTMELLPALLPALRVSRNWFPKFSACSVNSCLNRRPLPPATTM